MKKAWWFAVIAVLVVAGCRRKRETKVYYEDEEEVVSASPAHNQDRSCSECHEWNLVQIHDSSSPDYNDDCIRCHGDKQDPANEATLAEDYSKTHVNMCQYVYEAAGQDTMNNAVCVYCHQTVDLLGGSSAGLRLHVDADGCAQCHTSSGPGRELYQD